MSNFLLDTNIPSEIIRTLPDPRVDGWILAQDAATLFLSVVTIGELRKGLTILPESKRRSQLEEWLQDDLVPLFAGRILPVTQSIADRWGVLSGQRQIAGRPLSMADGILAATALEHGLTLATRNVRDYLDLGLTIYNPWEAGVPS
jgi:predicted nucleic acid-binding protein